MYLRGGFTFLKLRLMFQAGRVLHLAGRCFDCVACSRACPQDVDIRALNRKLGKDVKEVFNTNPASTKEVNPALSNYSTVDLQAFLVKE